MCDGEVHTVQIFAQGKHLRVQMLRLKKSQREQSTVSMFSNSLSLGQKVLNIVSVCLT